MTTHEADAARESARNADGRFGEQSKSAPEVSLMVPGSIDEHTQAVLRRKPAPTFEGVEAAFIRPGDVVEMQNASPEGDPYVTPPEGSPFRFAFLRDREFRKRWKAAGRPTELTVLERKRAAADGHTDDTIVFDLGGEPFELDFHRETLRVRSA